MLPVFMTEISPFQIYFLELHMEILIQQLLNNNQKICWSKFLYVKKLFHYKTAFFLRQTACLPVDVWVSKYAHMCGLHVRWRGVLGPPSQVLPAVLLSWSLGGGVPGLPSPKSFQQSFPAGPSWGGGGPRPFLPGPSSIPSKLGRLTDRQTCLTSALSYTSHETHDRQTDRLTGRQTRLKTLPSHKLRMRAIINRFLATSLQNDRPRRRLDRLYF